MLKQIAIFFSVIMLSACYYDNEEELYPGGPGGANCLTTQVTFAQDIQPLLTASCQSNSSCHVAGNSATIGDFSNYTGIKAKVDETQSGVSKVRQRVVILKDMPPSGLSTCNIEKIKVWLDAGAPNN